MWYSREMEKVLEVLLAVSKISIRHHSNCCTYYHIQCGPAINIHLLLLVLLITDHSDDIANMLKGHFTHASRL